METGKEQQQYRHQYQLIQINRQDNSQQGNDPNHQNPILTNNYVNGQSARSLQEGPMNFIATQQKMSSISRVMPLASQSGLPSITQAKNVEQLVTFHDDDHISPGLSDNQVYNVENLSDDDEEENEEENENRNDKGKSQNSKILNPEFKLLIQQATLVNNNERKFQKMDAKMLTNNSVLNETQNNNTLVNRTLGLRDDSYQDDSHNEIRGAGGNLLINSFKRRKDAFEINFRNQVKIVKYQQVLNDQINAGEERPHDDSGQGSLNNTYFLDKSMFDGQSTQKSAWGYKNLKVTKKGKDYSFLQQLADQNETIIKKFRQKESRMKIQRVKQEKFQGDREDHQYHDESNDRSWLKTSKQREQNGGWDENSDSQRYQYSRHTSKNRIKKQKSSLNQSKVLSRVQSISPIDDQNKFIEYYSNRMKEDILGIRGINFQNRSIMNPSEEIGLVGIGLQFKNQIKSADPRLDLTKMIRIPYVRQATSNKASNFLEQNLPRVKRLSEISFPKIEIKEAPQTKQDLDKTQLAIKSGRVSMLSHFLIEAKEDQMRSEAEEAAMKMQFLNAVNNNFPKRRLNRRKQNTCCIKFETFMQSFVILPDNQFRAIWGLVIATLVMITCVYAPYQLAFSQSMSISLVLMDSIINLIFFIDVFVNLLSAYQDQDLQIVDNPKLIAQKYLKTWFIVDLLSTIPFDLFQYYYNINISTLNKVSKMYKLIRVVRLAKMFKIINANSTMIKKITKIINIKHQVRRLISLTMVMMLLLHVVTCILIFYPEFSRTPKENWIYIFSFQDLNSYQLYVTSFYYTVATMMTVGYGDISAKTINEKILSIFLMMVGVVSFSYANGAISSIITNVDAAEAKLMEKMSTLETIKQTFSIDNEFFNKMVKSVKYDNRQSIKDMHKLMEELPPKLRIDLAMAIHKKMYSGVRFLQNRDNIFIVWVGMYLRAVNVRALDYVYKEGEEINDVYFLVSGQAQCVLRQFDNSPYLDFNKGDTFGHQDLAVDKEYLKNHQLMKNKKQRRKKKKKGQTNVDLNRIFTVMASKNCDLLTLNLDDLDKMHDQYPKIAKELLDDAGDRLVRDVAEKVNAIGMELVISRTKKNFKHKFSASLLYYFHNSLQNFEMERYERQNEEPVVVDSRKKTIVLQDKKNKTKSNYGGSNKNKSSFVPVSEIQMFNKDSFLMMDEEIQVQSGSKKQGEESQFSAFLNEPVSKHLKAPSKSVIQAVNDNYLDLPSKGKQRGILKKFDLSDKRLNLQLENKSSDQPQKTNKPNDDLDLKSSNKRATQIIESEKNQFTNNSTKKLSFTPVGKIMAGFPGSSTTGNQLSFSPMNQKILQTGMFPMQALSNPEEIVEAKTQNFVDSDESDENMIFLNQIKTIMSRLVRKIERLRKQMKTQKEEQRMIYIKMKNMAIIQTHIFTVLRQRQIQKQATAPSINNKKQLQNNHGVNQQVGKVHVITDLRNLPSINELQLDLEESNSVTSGLSDSKLDI